MTERYTLTPRPRPTLKSMIIERGRIYFFYRPRVERQQPSGFEDVQRFQVILSTHEKKLYRNIVVGHKQLPNPAAAGRAKFWGYVETASRDPDVIKKGLSEETYETKTRGTRHQPASRPAGEGVYAFLNHGPHMHLIYILEWPKDLGPVQHALNIHSEASYIVAVKDVTVWPPDEIRFVPMKNTAELNEPGTEIVLISAAADVSRELGIDLGRDEQDFDTAHVFEDLRLHEADHPAEPLIYGEWA